MRLGNRDFVGIAGALLMALGLTQAAGSTPNFIIILTDDQGFGDLGCNGSELIKTPHVDRMAAEAQATRRSRVAENQAAGEDVPPSPNHRQSPQAPPSRARPPHASGPALPKGPARACRERHGTQWRDCAPALPPPPGMPSPTR